MFVLSTYSTFQRLFHELLNQAYVYSFDFEYICHDDFKYNNEIPNMFGHFDTFLTYRVTRVKMRPQYICCEVEL